MTERNRAGAAGRLEVLAPAGDPERLEAAVRYGADAVYLAGRVFGMRAAPQNFTPEQLHAAVALCHQKGVRVYLACNTVPNNDEMDALPGYLREARDCGVDALIIADIGVLMIARRVVPELEIHMSTQAGIVSAATATELHRLGASRVVLARELPLGEIRRIRQNTPSALELECFVHGAMCMSFSGRCLLSDYIIGRGANRGECAQPCRWGYYLMEEKRPGEYYPIYEDERGSYILNAKDLCMIEHIDDLAEAGVQSLKIEGRAKSAYYTAVITNAYRCAVDEYRHNPDAFGPAPWIVEETRKVSHREYSTGFYYGRPENAQCYENGGYVREYEVAAEVTGWRDGRLYLIQRNRFFEAEFLEALAPGFPPAPLPALDLRDEAGEPLPAARHPMQPVSIRCEHPFPAGSILRRENKPQGPILG